MVNESEFVVKSLEKAFTDKKTSEKKIEFFDASDLKMPNPNYTGSLRLDIQLGIPFPWGRIVEVYGNPGSGKTTLALSVAASVVATGRAVLFIDQERRLSKGLVATFPILVENPDLFKIAKANTGDNALRLAEHWAKQWVGGLIIIDSVDALVPEAIGDKKIGESNVAPLPRLMSDGCRKLKDACDSSGSTIIFLNQLRSNIGGYGNPDTPSGGRALGFYSSQRIQLKDNAKSYQIKDDNGGVVGHNVRFHIAKNSYAVPFTDGDFPLIYGKGIDDAKELFDLSELLGLFEVDKKMFVIDGKKRHPKQVVDIIRADPDFAADLLKQVKESYPDVWPNEQGC
jgi:recombination protein RecA